MIRSARARHGFTIIELTMVISIIGVLVTILLPSLARAREAGRRAYCLANLSQLGMALRIYADESGGHFPWSGGANNARCLFPFMKETLLDYGTFVCPSDANHSLREFDESESEVPFDFAESEHVLNTFGLRCSYDYFGAYTEAPIALPPPTRAAPNVPLMWDAGANLQQEFNHVPGGSNVLWMDGSVSFMRHEAFAGLNLPYAPEGIAYLDPGEALRSGLNEETAFPWR
jgi:prepilin-type N-terminal cleavage/methylation domain-containing protein/prepilin-type processing-associated H-X9-DG protein